MCRCTSTSFRFRSLTVTSSSACRRIRPRRRSDDGRDAATERPTERAAHDARAFEAPNVGANGEPELVPNGHVNRDSGERADRESDGRSERVTFASTDDACSDPLELLCGDDVLEKKGEFALTAESVTFEVRLPLRGQLDAWRIGQNYVIKVPYLPVATIYLKYVHFERVQQGELEIMWTAGAHSSADGDGVDVLELDGVPGGDYLVVLSAEQSGTVGTYHVQVYCDSLSPTRTPSKSPTIEPSVYPTPLSTPKPSFNPTVLPTSYSTPEPTWRARFNPSA